MGVIKALDGNAAIAHGVMRSKVQLVAAYPITPQTPIVETIASLIDKKEYAATYITAESPRSAPWSAPPPPACAPSPPAHPTVWRSCTS